MGWFTCAGLPSNVRLASPQRCSPARNGRFARPCDRSAYTYTPSGRSPARLVSFSRVPLRWRRRSKPRMAPSGVRRGARGLGLSPAPCTAAPVVFTAIRAAMLRRRIHLLALRRVSPRIRRTASPHVAQFGTRPPRPLPHLPLWRVSFRSPCARRRSVSSLNLSRVSP